MFLTTASKESINKTVCKMRFQSLVIRNTERKNYGSIDIRLINMKRWFFFVLTFH